MKDQNYVLASIILSLNIWSLIELSDPCSQPHVMGQGFVVVIIGCFFIISVCLSILVGFMVADIKVRVLQACIFTGSVPFAEVFFLC